MDIHDLYRFWLDIPGKGITQVFPFIGRMEWEDKRKSGYRIFQRTLKNPLVLKDAPKDNINDFTLLYNLERQGLTCNKVDVIIDKYCDCTDTWTEGWYTGYLKLNQGEWDVTNCEVTIPVIPQDITACMTSTWDNQVNMFDYGDDPVAASPFVGAIQKTTCNSDEIVIDFNPIQPFAQIAQYLVNYVWQHLQYECLNLDIYEENEGFRLIKHSYISDWEFVTENLGIGAPNTFIRTRTRIRSRWAREFSASVTQPDGFGWEAVTGGWARPVNLIPLPFLDHTTGEGLDALEMEWSPRPFKFGFIQKWNIVGEDANGNSTFVNGKELGPVLRDLLVPCGISVVSNLFNINPDGTNPDNEYYDNAAEDFPGIILYQITDIARIDETQSAVTGLIKLKQLLDALIIVGNAQIDFDGSTLRIEHLSYWPDEVQMDLTLPEFIYLIEDKHKYTYDTDAQPKREVIGWDSETDGVGQDFDGYPIEYDNTCVNDDESKADKPYNAEGYLSNLLKIIGNEDYYDDTERVVMVSTKNLVIQSSLQPISGQIKLNGNLAMGYLIPRYYNYGRPFKEGYINKIQTPFYASLRMRLQAPINIPMSCQDYMENYTPGGLIKTQLGACLIETANYRDPDKILEAKLRAK